MVIIEAYMGWKGQSDRHAESKPYSDFVNYLWSSTLVLDLLKL
jgi:hypothetical protein